MLRLMLLRHAKSDWPDGVPDRERPLAPRGREAAPRMGRYLREEGLLPDRVIVSSARRAFETWECVAPFLDGPEVAVDARIYEAEPETLLAVIRAEGGGARTLLLVGHNPGFEELARRLVGHGDRYAFARLTQKYPTAGLAVIDFDASAWVDVEERAGRLDRFVTPKALDAALDGD